MKCQKCNANNATTHIKTVINGELREYDLCSECAQKMGYTSLFGGMESDFSNFLGSFFGNVLPARTQATRCEFCGSSYSEIAKSGHVGCAKCYEIIADQLAANIDDIDVNMTFKEDLGADSLDLVEFVIAMEEEFGIEISDEDTDKIKTVGDAVRYIEEHTEQ